MPAFSSSINKSDPNKRAAPKAPPRRAIRNATTSNNGSLGDESTSQKQSFSGTPDPYLGRDYATLETQTRPEVVPFPSGAISSAESVAGSATSATVDDSLAPGTAFVSLPLSRKSKAPNIISTISQQAPLPSDTEAHVPRQDSPDIEKVTEPPQSPRQIRASVRSTRGAKRTKPGSDAAIDVGVEELSVSNVAPPERQRGHHAGQDGHLTGANPCLRANSNANETDQVLEQGDLAGPGVQAVLKKSIRGKTRAPAKRTRILNQQENQGANGSQLEEPAPTRSRSTRGKKRKISAQQMADEIVEEATRGVDRNKGPATKKKKLKLTLEEAENHEIAPAEVRMTDLVKDQGFGKPSQRETEMQKIDWKEVKRKRREAQKEALQEAQKQQEARKNGRPLPPPGPHVAERLVLVNGQMVIDDSSRVIDRNAETAREADELGEAIDEDHLTKRVNQSTVGRKPGAVRTYSVWDDEETEQFYQGLRMFGTDFMMISKMFPGTSRALIKKKFSKEEKLNPEKILTALNSKEPIDLQAFSKITETVYEDPKDFYKELEEEQVRLEAEDAAMRAADAQAEQDVQESIEHPDQPDGAEAEHAQPEPSARKNRFTAEARSIMDGVDSRKKKGKKASSAKKKEGKKGKGLPAEGTEEMVGRIEDVAP